MFQNEEKSILNFINCISSGEGFYNTNTDFNQPIEKYNDNKLNRK